MAYNKEASSPSDASKQLDGEHLQMLELYRKGIEQAAEANALLKEQLERERTTVAQLQETLRLETERFEKEANHYQWQVKKLSGKMDRLDRTCSQVQQQAKEAQEAKDELARAELEIRSLQAKMTTAEQRIAQGLEQLANTRLALESIQNSRSWRITAPVRAALDFVKGNRRHTSQNQPIAEPSGVPEIQPNEPVPAAIPPLPLDSAKMLPESLYHNRESVKKLVERLAKYDIVSFDVFDTLLLRIFDAPVDVFRMMGHRLGEESFLKLRVQAEREARIRRGNLKKEVTIHDIYAVLSEYLSIDPEVGVQQELQAEKDCCIANPYLKEVFDELIRRGKRVILVSDMYLPQALLSELLAHCGYSGYTKLYVSCEYGHGKGSGLFQKKVIKEHPDVETIIHIGDNYALDVEKTSKAGWNTYFYPSCQELGDGLRPKNLDRLSVSAYRALVNTHLHCDDRVFTPAYEHGFRYAGFLVAGFCEWLNRYVEQNNIDRIFFLARDADILYKVYNRHYRKVENRYVVTSRLAMWEMAFETNPEDFIQNFFLSRANLLNQTIGQALEETDLEFLIPMLAEDGLRADCVLSEANYEDVHDFIFTHYKEVVEHFQDAKTAGQEYFREMVGDAKRICAVDIGWSGQILISMRKLFHEMFGAQVSLQGAYMALTNNPATSGYVECGIITPYLFHGCMNRDIAINTTTLGGDMQAKFMEATFTSDQRTLLKYTHTPDGEVEMVYGIKMSDDRVVHEMQQGVLDFVDLWRERTAEIRPFLQIMPYDAMMIMRQALENYPYCYAIFGDNQEWNFPLPNFKGRGSLTTLGAMLKNRGLV